MKSGVAVIALAVCATLLAVSHTTGRVELVDRHSGITPLQQKLAGGKGGAFAADWNGWLKKVTLQVKAAVDLAQGLPAAKKERLDGILGNDVAKDMTSGEAVAAGLKKRYATTLSSAAARRKAAVQAAAHSATKAVSKKTVSKTGGKADEEVERAAPHVSASQIKKPVAAEGKSGIDPYGKMLGNKVSADDALVQADENRVKMAENKLESEEKPNVGMPGAAGAAAKRPSRGRHVAQTTLQSPGKVLAKANALPHNALPHTDFEKGKKLLSAIDKKKAAHKLRAMQGDINLVLQSTPGDKKKAALEEKQEESQFSAEVYKLGLGGTAKAHRKAQHWPSQLELPGQGKDAKTPSAN